MDTTEIRCPHCQKLINSQAMFCEHCGRKVIQIPNGTPTSLPQNKKRFFNKTAWMIGGALTLFYLILYVVNLLETGYYERLPYFLFHLTANFLIYSFVAALLLWVIGKISSVFRKK